MSHCVRRKVKIKHLHQIECFVPPNKSFNTIIKKKKVRIRNGRTKSASEKEKVNKRKCWCGLSAERSFCVGVDKDRKQLWY